MFGATWSFVRGAAWSFVAGTARTIVCRTARPVVGRTSRPSEARAARTCVALAIAYFRSRDGALRNPPREEENENRDCFHAGTPLHLRQLTVELDAERAVVWTWHYIPQRFAR
jgi:hypothetical protein